MIQENSQQITAGSEQAPAPPSVVVAGVTKRYGTFHAVRDVSFQLARGEFLTLLGPSGSGKTTSLMIVAGFEQPTEGRIEVAGRDVVGLPPKKRNFGIVFQGYALFPHKSAMQNVEFPLKMRGVSKAERRRLSGEMLERVGLSKLMDRKPREMSGGQQQRVALARALVFKPDALLLDEPLGALDKNMREKMQYEIKELQKTLGISVLFVTHDQEEAMSMSDRIAVMNEGRIVQIGSPVEVYQRPQSTFVANFLGETNMMPCVVGQLDATEARVSLDGMGECRATPMGDTSGFASGKAAVVSVRPEKMRLLLPGETADNMLTGRLLQHTFVGRHSRSVIGVGDTTFNVISGSDSALMPPVRGGEVRLGWASRDAQLLPAGD